MQATQSREFRQSLKKQHIHIPDKDINLFIHELQPKQHNREQYQKFLESWNDYMFMRKNQLKKANSILTQNTKKTPNSVGSNLCQLCYNQMTRKKNWCRICGNEFCQNCIGRLRVINDDQTPALFCQKCDKQYIIAIIFKEEEENFALRERSFIRLAQQQQMIQSLLKIQKHKLLTAQEKQGQNKNVLLQKMNQLTQLSTANQNLRSQIADVKKKIDWGQEIHVHLKKKLKKYKKNQSHSFTSSSVADESEKWAPPQVDAQDYVSAQNLNQSIINSILQTQTNTQQKNQLKCNCKIF